MKRPEFLETKRTPRYSLRKLNVGVASVLLGVTIFGINFTDHSVKAATTGSVEYSNSLPNSNSQQTSAVVLTAAEQANAQKATSATEKVQQNSASNDATEKVQQSSASNNAIANNSTKAATTSQFAPKTQGSADTDIRSSAAKSAAKLAFMNLVAIPGTANDTNPQPANENNELANKSNLTSSDNYSSNIYKGTDGKYYKIVTIYGTDYVYHVADIQASGANWLNQPKQTAADTKNNLNISKEDLGNGQTRWTVVFFPNKGLQNVGSKLSGLCNATFGIALTSDYQIVGKVDMEVISDPNQSFVAHTFEPGSSSATDITIQNPSPEVKFSFDPKTDVEPNGLINSGTMPAYNNKYLQGPYYFTTDTDTGKKNLWQTYFEDGKEYYNAADGTPYLGSNHDFHFNTFKIANETGVDGAKYNDPLIYDTRGGVNGVFSSDNFTQAMEFKSQGTTGNGKTQFSSYVISFITQHTDSYEVGLIKSPTGQQFSGISANIYSYQNLGYTNMMSSLYGEQRALDAKGNPVEAKDIISNWEEAKAANKAIDDALVNKKGEINNATNIDQATKDNLIKEATDAAGAAKNAISQATTADAIKKAQDDGVSNINNVKVPSLDDAKSDAKNAIDQAAQTKDAAIDAAPNLTAEEKADLKKQVSDAANEAKGKIDAATKDADVKTAQTDGEQAINNVNVPDTSATKDAAKNAIDQAAQTKDNAIDAAPNLTAEEKADLKKQVSDAANEAKGKIDAATKDADVKTAQTDGEQAINAVEIPTSSKTKNDANSDLDNTADAAKKAIDETSGLTDDQKQTAKDQIDKAVDDAKENIKNASDNKGVADATDAGKLAIDKVSAKAAIDAAVAAKKSEIAQAPLTAEEAKPLNNLVDQEADAAKAAIDAATTSAAVETAKNNGVETINNIKVPTTSATKDDANKAIDAALAKKIEEINNANLTDDQKQSLIDQAQNAANQAKENIRNASTDEDVQTARNNGIAAIEGITVKSNSVDDQDNSATNAGDSSQTGHIQSDSTGNVTNPSAQQAAGSGKDQLPQTGDETQHGAGLVGLALAGLVGLLGSAGFRKKRD
jgi:LPXTG-motif cell wall-anchored protein